MEVCEELLKLSGEFNKLGHKLYIVGGYVRDNILGLDSQDIDITSSMKTDDVEKICKKLKLKYTSVNKHLGTILITFGKFKFEYTTFRKESYGSSGVHTPDTIEFVDDINVDYLRRDYTINSIYWDISEGKFVDPSGGLDDIKSRTLRTPNHPRTTLADDGLRILRGVRFASTYDFRIDRKSMSALKTFAPLLNKISKERILKEIQLLSVADLKYNIPNTHFLRLCNQLGLSKYIFNSTLSRMKKFTKDDMERFYNLSQKARLIGLYLIVVKNYLIGYTDSQQLGYNINMLLGRDGIKESKETCLVVERLYRVYQNLIHDKDSTNATVNYLTFSDTEREVIDGLLNAKTKSILDDNIAFIKKNNLPISVHQLDITAEDLINAGIDRIYISKIMSTLFNQVLNMTVKNKNEDLVKLAKEIHETFLSLNKETK